MKITNLFIFIAFVLSLFVSSAAAATFTVTNTADAGAGSLRQAVADADNQPGADEIRFNLAAGAPEIRLTSGEIVISESLTINGTGARGLRISGGDASRVFRVAAGSVTINNVTVWRGRVAGANNFGGAIYNAGALVLNFVAVSDSQAGTSGGAIYNADGALLTLNNCLVARNRSFAAGGGVYNDGGAATFANTTFYQNDANSNGGAIYQARGGISLRSATVRKNTATGGNAGGVFVSSGASLFAFNTVIAENAAASAPDVFGAFTSSGYNLISNTTGSSGFPATGDLINAPSLLLDLADNGGQTDTCQPHANSPAINAGSFTNQPPNDQRGYPRPAGGRGDIGAFEYNSQLPAAGAVDLQAASDSGVSATDNLTNARNPVFDITWAHNTIVELLRDNVVVASAYSIGPIVSVADPNPPANGAAIYTARLVGGAASAAFDLPITYDTTAPTVSVNQAAGQPDPTTVQPINFTIDASEPLYNFDGEDFAFTGTADYSAVFRSLTANSAIRYTLSLTGIVGGGTVTPSLPAGAVTDAAGNPNSASISTDNTVSYFNFVVTIDADTAPNGCTTANCTLREAIEAANASASNSPPTIGFDPAFFNAARTITLARGELAITRNIVIHGLGANLTSVSGGNAARVFAVDSGAATLNNLTVRNGSADYGGAIRNSGALTINDSILSDNAANYGAAIYNDGGSVTLNRTRVAGASAQFRNAAIYNNSGTITLNRSTVSGFALQSGNETAAGGIFNNTGATLNLNDSTVSGNSINTMFSNANRRYAGGIFNNGTANLIRSTVSGNSARRADYVTGGIYNHDNATLTVVNSTVSGNRGADGDGINTGGIISFGTASVTNSTVTGNESGSLNGGCGVQQYSGTFTIHNNIIADNCPSSGIPDASGTFASQGYNLVGFVRFDSSGWTANDTTNLPSGGARLLPLADNGGATQTHALRFDSPAVDRADPNNVLPIDQRGTARPVGGRADSGAFELVYNCAGIALSVSSQPQNVAVAVGQTASFSINVTSNRTYLIQWQQSADNGATWTNIAGANGATFAFAASQAQNGYRFRAVVTAECGAQAVSDAATLTIDCSNSLQITAQPQSVSVLRGGSATFTVSFSSTASNAAMQWQQSADGGATWTNIAGANQAMLSFAAALSQNGYRFRAVVTNACNAQATSDEAILTVAAPPCAALPAGVAAWYRAEGSADDSIGGNHGTFHFNGGVYHQAGKIGRAFEFNGGTASHNAVVAIPDADALKPPRVSVETWVRAYDLNRWQALVFKKNTRASNFEGYALYLSDQNRLRFQVAGADGAQYFAEWSTPIAAHNWYHVVGAFDGAALKIYVNGELRHATAVPAGFRLDYGTERAFLGRTNETNFMAQFVGLLDEVKIYNRALTAPEAAAGYNADDAGSCAVNRWTGAASSEYSAAANWSNNTVPTGAGATAFVTAASAPHQPVVSGNISVENVNLAAGKTLTVTNSATLSISGTASIDGTIAVGGNLNLTGAITGAGTINFNGAAAQIVPAAIYPNLTVSNAGASLGGDITVRQTLDLGATVFDAGAHKIVLPVTANVARTSGYVRGRVEKQFNAGASGAFTFPVGTANGYSPVTAANTANGAAGGLIVSATQSAHSTASGAPNRINRFWTLTGAGGLNVNLTFKYLNADVQGADETALRLFKIAGGNASQQTGAIYDYAANTAQINNVTTFSDWTLFSTLAPTAASVTVGGRVVDESGRGISKAVVRLTDASGVARYAATNPFGFYRFANVTAGATVIVTASAKNHAFAPQVINVAEDITELNFVGQP